MAFVRHGALPFASVAEGHIKTEITGCVIVYTGNTTRKGGTWSVVGTNGCVCVLLMLRAANSAMLSAVVPPVGQRAWPQPNGGVVLSTVSLLD